MSSKNVNKTEKQNKNIKFTAIPGNIFPAGRFPSGPSGSSISGNTAWYLMRQRGCLLPLTGAELTLAVQQSHSLLVSTHDLYKNSFHNIL